MIAGTIKGHLVKDPEIRQLGKAQAAVFTVASNNPYRKDQDETSSFVNCTFFGQRGENFAKFHSKGDPVQVLGTLFMRTWKGENDYVGKELCADIFDFEFAKPSGGGGAVNAPAAAVNTAGTQTGRTPSGASGGPNKANTPKAAAAPKPSTDEYDPFADE